MCHFELSIASVEQAYPVTFATYFENELSQLRQMEQDGLLTMGEKWLSVTPRGRLLIRNICMVFDRYLQEKRAEGPRYSRTI